MKANTLKKACLSACVIAFSGCHDNISGTSNAISATDSTLRNIIVENNLQGDPLSGKTIPSINHPTTQLGRDLFFSKLLSGNRDVACASCHHPVLGGGDRLSLSIGVEAATPDALGLGRVHSPQGKHHDGGPTVPRNAPTTFNIAAWEQVLFHDGRVEAVSGDKIRTPDSPFGTADELAGENLVHAQARFPVTSPEEMKGFSHDDKDNQQIRDFLAQRMGGYDKGADLISYPDFWLNKFRTAYKKSNAGKKELINEQNIAFLLAEYQRSQQFTETPWKYYVEGDNKAISRAAKKGALLFFRPANKGGANCASCHSSDFFSDEKFHNIAMPQIGRGKGDGDGSDDFGRFRETKAAKDKYAFRTPTLLNVEMTGPWGHSGAYTSLEGVIRHHLDPAAALATYDYGQLNQPGIQNLDTTAKKAQQALAASSFSLEPIKLSDQEVGYLVEFMKTLTDPCTKDRECLSPWIADSTTDNDPNGDQLNALGL